MTITLPLYNIILTPREGLFPQGRIPAILSICRIIDRNLITSLNRTAPGLDNWYNALHRATIHFECLLVSPLGVSIYDWTETLVESIILTYMNTITELVVNRPVIMPPDPLLLELTSNCLRTHTGQRSICVHTRIDLGMIY